MNQKKIARLKKKKSSRAPALEVQSPEFKLQSHQTKWKQKEEL
jgi:hypothetical protein